MRTLCMMDSCAMAHKQSACASCHTANGTASMSAPAAAMSHFDLRIILDAAMISASIIFAIFSIFSIIFAISSILSLSVIRIIMLVVVIFCLVSFLKMQYSPPPMDGIRTDF